MVKKPTTQKAKPVLYQSPMMRDPSIFSGGSPRSAGDAAEAQHAPIHAQTVPSSLAKKIGSSRLIRTKKRQAPKRKNKTRS